MCLLIIVARDVLSPTFYLAAHHYVVSVTSGLSSEPREQSAVTARGLASLLPQLSELEMAARLSAV
jgi:hypothetical protein